MEDLRNFFSLAPKRKAETQKDEIISDDLETADLDEDVREMIEAPSSADEADEVVEKLDEKKSDRSSANHLHNLL